MTPSRNRGDETAPPVRLTPSVAGLPTIGVITAIPEEFAAARVMLDDPVEYDSAADQAPYVLGRLPSRQPGVTHPVVLTQLGLIATSAAADGCANLLRTFPSVSTVVMVGIAAGVPSPHQPERHVRLGDVVVATEGVIPYDQVCATGDGARLRRGFPLPSPRLIRCADMLRVDELNEHRPWEQWLSRGDRLLGYRRPADRTDVLISPGGYPQDHPRRNRSGHRAGFPKIHYGRIGSADRSVWDVATRDRLAAQHGFLAIEMEATGIGTAGFLNGTDWFVVRGVSDYADRLRSDAWRRYSALTAAAYTRALLEKSRPLRPQQDSDPARPAHRA